MTISSLRFLADESCDISVVHALRTKSAGVILIRYPGNARRELIEAITKLVNDRGNELPGAFVVVQPGHIRISGRASH